MTPPKGAPEERAVSPVRLVGEDDHRRLFSPPAAAAPCPPEGTRGHEAPWAESRERAVSPVRRLEDRQPYLFSPPRGAAAGFPLSPPAWDVPAVRDPQLMAWGAPMECTASSAAETKWDRRRREEEEGELDALRRTSSAISSAEARWDVELCGM